MAIDIKKYKGGAQVNTEDGSGFNISEYLNRDIQLFGNTFSDKTKESFYSELHALLDAGIDLITSLDLIIAEQKKSRNKQVFETIKNDLIKGMSLQDAMKKCGMFSPYEYYSVQIGEESGKLESVLYELGAFYSEKISQRQKLISAVSYPIVVIITAVFAVVFLLKFIVPLFADVFLRFGGELPLITRYVLALSDFMSDFFWWIVLMIVALAAVVYSQRRSGWFRKLISKSLLYVPFGNLIYKIYLSRFCRSMSLLISSDVTIMKSIELVQKMISFLPLEESLEKVGKQVYEGKSLHESLRDHSIFEDKLVAMVKVGEEANQLDKMFQRLYEQYRMEVESRIATISSLLEPLLILVLGLIIGFILIAIYLPIFELSTNIL